MREKKKVLLYCRDPQRLSVTKLVLRERGIGIGRYLDVCAVDSAASLIQLIEKINVERLPWAFNAAVLLETRELDHCEALVRRMKQLMPALRIVLQVPRGYGLHITQADAVLPEGSTIAELTERLRIFCTRKRGPKPLRGVLDALPRVKDRTSATEMAVA